MRSRRDQVQAYFFVVGRLVAAMLKGQPDTHEPPNRRLSMGIAIGTLLSVLITAGFGIYGLFRPGGSDAWRKPGSVILVKETGARYLLIEGQLRPVLNYTSARLVLGNTAPITSVARKSLSGVPVGAPIGISGAPDALPPANQLYTGVWTVCARPSTVATDPAQTVLVLTGDAGQPLPDGQGLLLVTPDNSLHLVWQERRYRLGGAGIVSALGYGAVKPIRVAAGWLNPIPAGRDLTPPRIAGHGSRGPDVAGRLGLVGQVYELRNPALGTSDFYLLRTDGLVLLSRTAAALVLGDPATRLAYPGLAVQPIPIGPDALAGHEMADSAEYVIGYPPVPPQPVNDIGSALPCVRQQMQSGGGASVTIVAVPPEAVRDAVAPAASPGGAGVADAVMIPTGSGILARNRARPGAAPGAVYLVSEFGVKFPVPDDATLGVLGYGAVKPVDVSSELLALLPTGPVLSSAAALSTQQVGR